MLKPAGTIPLSSDPMVNAPKTMALSFHPVLQEILRKKASWNLASNISNETERHVLKKLSSLNPNPGSIIITGLDVEFLQVRPFIVEDVKGQHGLVDTFQVVVGKVVTQITEKLPVFN